jgi:pimeloyl-ACP methyl ester carboxylesterase
MSAVRRFAQLFLTLGGIAAGLAIATWIARPRRRIAPAVLAPPAEFLWASGVQTHLAVHGTDGPTVVLLHGMRGWFLTWRHVVPELSTRARVILIDLKGFGLSTLPSSGVYNVDGLAAHVLATLDALELKAPILGGLSLGGEVALRVTLQAPQRVGGLILMGSTGYARSTIVQWLIALAPPFLQLTTARLFMRARWTARRNLRRSFARPERVTRTLVDLYQKPTEVAGSEEAFLAMLGAPACPSISDRISQIKVPTLLIWGQKDRIVGGLARRFREDLPHAEFHEVPDAGHVTVEEQPDAVTHLILDWLSRTFPATGGSRS